jgi:cytochrome c-type biogenesis protein CcmE
VKKAYEIAFPMIGLIVGVRKSLIAFLVIGIAVGFTMWAFSSSMTPYVDIKTALRSDTPVQVRGRILHDGPDRPKPFYDDHIKALRFWIEDQNKSQIEVVYHGAKPDSFDTAPETAAHGVARKNPDGTLTFVSDSLVVKCPSKYDDTKGPYKKNAPGGKA